MKIFLLIVSVVFAANAQTAAVQPKFEVASVKRTDRFGGGSSIDAGYINLRGLPLKAVLMEAFQVKIEQIEGPSWLESDYFDISAKLPEGSTREQVPAMLQALLTERFKLAAHKDNRTRPGFAMVVDKGGPKFKEDDPDAAFMGPKKGMMLFGRGRLKGVMSMATLASNLSRQGYGPVQDATGLEGKYGIDLSWAPNPDFEPAGAFGTLPLPADPPGADLFTAVRESLGLKLERRPTQVQFLVIERIERVPTEN